MVYTSSLTMLAKKALGAGECFQTSVSKIISQLTMDPEVTGMTAVLLGPNDFGGMNKQKLITAIEAGYHPDICLMYIYTKDSEAQGINVPYKKGVSKIKTSDIQKFVEESMADHSSHKEDITESLKKLEEQDDLETETEDYHTPDIPNMDKTFYKEPELVKVPVPEVKLPEEEVEPVKPAYTPPTPKPEPKAVMPGIGEAKPQKPIGTREDMLAEVRSIEDFNLLKEALDKDNIYKSLLEENAEYAGTIQMLDVLEKEINAIYFDETLSATTKFEKIREVGLKKSTLKAVSNNIAARKVLSMIDTVTTQAKKIVTERVNSLNEALAKITTDEASILDTSKISQATSERAQIHVEFLDILYKLRKLYGDMDTLVVSDIEEMKSKLPSDNAFINNMVNVTDTDMYNPTNTSKLINDLMKGLAEKRITMSQLEEDVTAMVNLIYTLLGKDEDIIKHQHDLIERAKANRVEELVIRDGILKNVLHLYVGADDTGRTATTLTWSGVQSRRNNTLLIDITGSSQLERYGADIVDLNTFMNQRLERSFLVVKSERRLDSAEVINLIHEIKSRLNYYATINVVVHPEDKEAIDLLSKEALSISYITNCNNRSIDVMKSCIERTQIKNIAKKIITIDAPINPMQIMEALGVDTAIYELVPLPNLPTIRACALRHDTPYDKSDLIGIFERVFH